jgi:hypothetical protein
MAGRLGQSSIWSGYSSKESRKGELTLDSDYANTAQGQRGLEPTEIASEQLTLKDPRAVLSLLEADQVVAAKRRTHFGRQDLSFGVRILLWCLRVYVVAMLIIVALSVFRAFHAVR